MSRLPPEQQSGGRHSHFELTALDGLERVCYPQDGLYLVTA